MRISAHRWPWQSKANQFWGRFGGGWNYKFGIDIGSNSIILNLGWGMIRFDFSKRKHSP